MTQLDARAEFSGGCVGVWLVDWLREVCELLSQMLAAVGVNFVYGCFGDCRWCCGVMVVVVVVMVQVSECTVGVVNVGTLVGALLLLSATSDWDELKFGFVEFVDSVGCCFGWR